MLRRRKDEVLGELPEKAMFLTLYFGVRRREPFGLQIHHIDFVARGIWLLAHETKRRGDEFLPGGNDAMAFLALLAGEAQMRETAYLITWRRHEGQAWKPMASAKRAWADAMEVIAAEFGARWRWHDIRAAYITQVALTTQSGAVVQSMARHAHFATTELYIDVANELRAEAAERATARPALRAVSGGK